MQLKPMLGYNKPYDLDALPYPLFGSPKLDGIRCLVKDGVPLSRKLLPIPNRFVQAWARENAEALEGFDGELVVGPWHAPDLLRRTMSAVSSHDGEPNFELVVFDLWNRPENSFDCRRVEYYSRILERQEGDEPPRCAGMKQTLLATPGAVREYEARAISEGYEGVILRRPDALYKYGRSTLKEGALLKLKQFEDIEVTVFQIVEAVRNDNEATTDELGHTKRSHSKEGRTEGKGYVGAMWVRMEDGREFKVGTFRGLTIEDKTEIFENQEKYLGRTAKVKVMVYGEKDVPRHGVFLDWRADFD